MENLDKDYSSVKVISKSGMSSQSFFYDFFKKGASLS